MNCRTQDHIHLSFVQARRIKLFDEIVIYQCLVWPVVPTSYIRDAYARATLELMHYYGLAPVNARRTLARPQGKPVMSADLDIYYRP